MTGLPQPIHKTIEQNSTASTEHPKGTFPVIRVRIKKRLFQEKFLHLSPYLNFFQELVGLGSYE